jgi:hypothetical protein
MATSKPTAISVDQKLAEDVKALLRANGYTDLTSHASAGSINISGVKGAAGALFHMTAQRPSKADRQSGGSLAEQRATDVTVVPTFPGLREHMSSDPASAAKLLGITPELVTHMVATNKMA